MKQPKIIQVFTKENGNNANNLGALDEDGNIYWMDYMEKKWYLSIENDDERGIQ